MNTIYTTEYATTNHINMVNELAKKGWWLYKVTILGDEPFYVLSRELTNGVPSFDLQYENRQLTLADLPMVHDAD